MLRLTNGSGVDHVIEMGGSATILQSIEATKRGGLLSQVGILSEMKEVNLIPALMFGAKTSDSALSIGLSLGV